MPCRFSDMEVPSWIYRKQGHPYGLAHSLCAHRFSVQMMASQGEESNALSNFSRQYLSRLVLQVISCYFGKQSTVSRRNETQLTLSGKGKRRTECLGYSRKPTWTWGSNPGGEIWERSIWKGVVRCWRHVLIILILPKHCLVPDILT